MRDGVRRGKIKGDKEREREREREREMVAEGEEVTQRVRR